MKAESRSWSLVYQQTFTPGNQLKEAITFFSGNDFTHTCVVELPRKAQVEGEVGDLRPQLPLRLQQSL